MWAKISITVAVVFAIAGQLRAADLPPAASPPSPSAATLNCSPALPGAMQDKWESLGQFDGRLGCGVEAPRPTAPSPKGSIAHQAVFENGLIVQYDGGPLAGQTFAVYGCLYRLYFQYGGPGGWLGLPVGDALNTPDGQKQEFEGGHMRYLRTPDTCTAEQ